VLCRARAGVLRDGAPEGRFEVALPAGEWCVVSSARAPVRPSRAATTAPKQEGSVECADSLWLQCEAILDTRAGDVPNARLTRSGRCSWDAPCRHGPPGPRPP
jgi:hypothetical protein